MFALIALLWVGYLVPKWLSRREHTSAARSVDRFTSALRGLGARTQRSERTSVAPTYTVSPPRDDVRDFVVKRATPVAQTSGPKGAPRTGASKPVSLKTRRVVEHSHVPGTIPGGVAGIHNGSSLGASRAVALVMLTFLIAAPLQAVLAGMSVLSWYWAIGSVVGVVVCVATLRRMAVMRERAARRVADDIAQVSAELGGARKRRPVRSTARAAVAEHDYDDEFDVDHDEDVDQALQVASVADTTPDLATIAAHVNLLQEAPPELADVELADVERVAPAAEPAAAQRTAPRRRTANDVPGAWDPIEVPKPLYQLKRSVAPEPTPEPSVEVQRFPAPQTPLSPMHDVPATPAAGHVSPGSARRRRRAVADLNEVLQQRRAAGQ